MKKWFKRAVTLLLAAVMVAVECPAPYVFASEKASPKGSIYIVGGDEPDPAPESTVIDVIYNFVNVNNVHLKKTEVIEYELKDGESTVSSSYTIPVISGKNASLASDTPACFSMSDGVISASLNGSKTEYIVNVLYKSTPAKYTVRPVFEKLDGTGYAVDPSILDSYKVDSETGDMTDVSAPAVMGFTPQKINQNVVKEDGSTVIEI